MSEAEVRIGLIGDLHGAFDPVDSEQLDACEYERLVFVGDLGPGTLEADRKVARAMARLRTPTMVMPGNNDAAHAPKLRAELGHQRAWHRCCARAVRRIGRLSSRRPPT